VKCEINVWSSSEKSRKSTSKKQATEQLWTCSRSLSIADTWRPTVVDMHIPRTVMGSDHLARIGLYLHMPCPHLSSSCPHSPPNKTHLLIPGLLKSQPGRSPKLQDLALYCKDSHAGFEVCLQVTPCNIEVPSVTALPSVTTGVRRGARFARRWLDRV
jgi:hypothetical protein